MARLRSPVLRLPVRRLVTEAALGYIAFAYIAFGEVERLLALARVTEAGGPAGFSPSVLTTPNVAPPLDLVWSRTELGEVFAVLAGPDGGLVTRLLCWYLVTDLAFAVALSWLLRSLLIRLGRSAAPAVGYLAADLAETGLGLIATLTDQLTNPWLLNPLSLLSAAKWAALAGAVGLILLTWWRNVRPAVGGAPRPTGTPPRPPWLRMAPQVLVVVAFLLLMAVPGPSAMTQLPDVLRAGLEGDGGREGAFSTFAFLSGPFLLAAAVAVSTWLATETPSRPPLTVPKAWEWWWPTAVGFVGSLVVVGLLAADGDAKPAAAAWVGVPLAILALGLAASLVIPLDDAGLPPTAAFPAATRRHLATGLTGAVLVGASLGLVRAALPPALLDVEGPTIPYPLLALAGLVGAVLSPLAMELAAGLTSQIRRRRTALRRTAHTGVLVLLAVAVVRLARDPLTAAPQVGTAGVIVVAFGSAAVAAALLTRLSLLSPRSEPLRQLRIGGGRPSWLVYLLAVWIVSSLLGGPTGYHDARTTTLAGGTAPTLGDAVATWVETHAVTGGECVTTTADRGVVPLVLVAAPGGGIRAAYWTAAALDGLFATEDGRSCPGALFAVAAVSGGSVGGTVRLLTEPTEPSLPAVRAMAQDHALAANVAALFFRDFPQSWFPATDRWDDRAAVHERAWEEDAPVLAEAGTADIGVSWAGADGGGRSPDGRAGWPGVLLGSSSINDGCRAFTSSWSGVVAAGNGCTDRGDATFALTAAHDLGLGLVEPLAAEHTPAELPAVTAALLSARFPWVSPSGAVRRLGVPGEPVAPDVLYLADGGIYENTALLALLQAWDAIEAQVAGHNRAVLAVRGAEDPGVLVEPWLVFLNNGFEAAAPPPDTDRPRELSAPISSVLQRVGQVAIGETALLQAADLRFTGPLPGTTLPAEHATRVVVLRPTGNDPGLTAPLGWVLAPSTQETLDRELEQALTTPGAAALLERLRAGG